MVTHPAILTDGDSSSFLMASSVRVVINYQSGQHDVGESGELTGHILEMFCIRTTHISTPIFKD